MKKNRFIKIFIFLFSVNVILYVLIFIKYSYNTIETTFNQQYKSTPIYSVDIEDKNIALTFDVNWGDNNIDEILDILDEYNIKATFFVIGKWAQDNKEEVKKIYDRGHSIGNHSYVHKDFSQISNEVKIEEINKCDDVLYNITGEKPILFRFPSGSYDSNSVDLVNNMNKYPIQWDVDSIDWKEEGANIEFERVINKTHNGSIILLHTNAMYTPVNLSKIIKDLQEKRYKFVKVEELIYKETYYIDNNGKQIKKRY
ncbi:MAG: polysaccharide deacetylase family protein [Clostridiaceae bacterium]